MSLLYRAKHAKKPKLHVPLGAWLSYLIVATVVLTGVSFSKFATSEQNSGNANANIAVVVLDGGGDADTALLIDETNIEDDYSFYVANNADGRASDVALDYTLSVEFPDGTALPEGAEMMLEYSDAGEFVEMHLLSEVDGVYTYTGGADFAAGVEQQHDYRLSFKFGDVANLAQDYNFTDISISVRAEQLA